MQNVAPNLWLIPYPLKMAGVDLRRNVSVIRLSTGKLIIHSTGPFSASDVTAIRALGEPAWMVDTLLRHDTFSKEGIAAFPGIPYLAPPGFSENFPTQPLLPPPSEWNDEIKVAEIDGAPEFGEYVMLHCASKTLIVADLVINFGDIGFWGNFVVKIATVGGKHSPGVTKPFRSAVDDVKAFAYSVSTVLQWDFDRVIVGHGDMIETNGKQKIQTAMREAGLLHS